MLRRHIAETARDPEALTEFMGAVQDANGVVVYLVDDRCPNVVWAAWSVGCDVHGCTSQHGTHVGAYRMPRARAVELLTAQEVM